MPKLQDFIRDDRDLRRVEEFARNKYILKNKKYRFIFEMAMKDIELFPNIKKANLDGRDASLVYMDMWLDKLTKAMTDDFPSEKI